MLEGSTGTMMVSARRVDHQNLGGARHIAQAVLEGGSTADRRQISRALRQPIEAGTLRIVIGDAHLMTVAGEEHGDIGGQGTLAASALRIQNHYMTHVSPALLFPLR